MQSTETGGSHFKARHHSDVSQFPPGAFGTLLWRHHIPACVFPHPHRDTFFLVLKYLPTQGWVKQLSTHEHPIKPVKPHSLPPEDSSKHSRRIFLQELYIYNTYNISADNQRIKVDVYVDTFHASNSSHFKTLM